MRHLGTSRPASRSQLTLILIGAISLLMMPVDYRGGSAVSHPHALVQLVEDVSHGSLVHHHHEPSAGHRHGNELRHPAEPAFPPPRPVMLVPSAGQAASLTPLLHLVLSPPATDQPVAADDPSLSPRSSTGKYVVYSLALPVALVLLGQVRRRRLDWPAAIAWLGISPAPEPPPPQPRPFDASPVTT